jgi:hypothetical protein
MDRKTYDGYLAKFNARDYHGVLEYFAENFEVSFAGYSLRSRAAVLDFYRFLHGYVEETIAIDRFLSDESTLVLEARVHLLGIKDLSPEAARKAGFERLAAPPAGKILVIPQFIHYHLEGGKFVKALCAVVEPGE